MGKGVGGHWQGTQGSGEKSYLEKSLNQVILGNYADDVTLLGTAAQMALGFTGLDLAADIRDLIYDLTHWQWTWGHAGQTALDGIGLVPVIGLLKNADEVGDLGRAALRQGDGASDAVKHTDEVVEGAGKLTRREQLLNTVQNDKLKNAVNEIYRPGATIGDGGLADAVRHELSMGELVGGKSHILKATERVTNLENIINKQNLSPSDLEIAKSLLEDLINALGGK